jgi:hypothetical protein
VAGRLRRDGTGRDHGYPGGRLRPPRYDPADATHGSRSGAASASSRAAGSDGRAEP